jgi:flagellar motor switch/type III secretory pathway protein FliN
MTAEPTPFPWSGVPRLNRAGLRARRELRARLGVAFDYERLGRALKELLGDDVRLETAELDTRRGGTVPFSGLECLSLRFPVHGVRLWLRPEPELWRCALARLLDQDFQLGWADSTIDATLRGAGAALLLELARRSARAEAPELAPSEAPSPAWPLVGTASVRVGERLYRVELCVGQERASGVAGVLPPPALERLGELRLRVPWVAALSSIALELLESLQVGDVWLPGAGAWVAAGEAGEAGVLVPAGSRRGIPVRVQAGRTVLGAEIVAVPEEVEVSMSQEDSELERVVGETPVVVRLELGAIEMSAAEWAALRPGDVLASGRRVEEAVSLRSAGREIARGELVEIEGEIGVRITQVGLARAGS